MMTRESEASDPVDAGRERASRREIRSQANRLYVLLVICAATAMGAASYEASACTGVIVLAALLAAGVTHVWWDQRFADHVLHSLKIRSTMASEMVTLQQKIVALEGARGVPATREPGPGISFTTLIQIERDNDDLARSWRVWCPTRGQTEADAVRVLHSPHACSAAHAAMRVAERLVRADGALERATLRVRGMSRVIDVEIEIAREPRCVVVSTRLVEET